MGSSPERRMAADTSVASSSSNSKSKPRLKREDCQRTKHDSAFSDWKILVGSSDWEDHLLGKEGAERYRTQNLPNCSSCSGVYELGIAVDSLRSAQGVSKLDPYCIIPVYIGQADNVRTRLQHYGREGAHLENGYSNGDPNNCNNVCNQTELGLFREVFSRGYSIVYRWAPMNNKRVAEKVEAQLLDKFDYAWNKGSNGARRPNDILQKLDQKSSNVTKYSRLARKLRIFHQKQGVKIKVCTPFLQENGSSFYTNQQSNDLFSRIFKFGRSQPRLVSMRFNANEDLSSICGVALGQGSVCTMPQVKGRKRCAEHKGMKINGFTPKLVTEGRSPTGVLHKARSPRGFSSKIATEEKEHCLNGPILECRPHYNSYERICLETCKPGTEQSQVSAGRCGVSRDYDPICVVDLENRTFCTREPIAGQKRFKEAKGMKVKKPISLSLAAVIPSVFDACHEQKQNNVSAPTCGATNLDGSFCRRKPTEGSKRCWQHQGMRVDTGLQIRTPTYNNISVQSILYGSPVNEGTLPTCAAPNLDGSFCGRKPAKGNKRCWQHKGTRADAGSGASICDDEVIFHLKCGTETRNGAHCSRTPAKGRRCWQQ